MTIGLLAIGATTFVAPYQWRGETSPYAVTGAHPVSGSTHAPVWESQQSIVARLGREEGMFSTGVNEVTLNAGVLGLWWAGIAMATGVLVLLAKGTSEG